MNTLFEILQTNDLVSRTDVNTSAVESLSKAQIIEISEALVEASQPQELQRKASIFTHSASLSLGGGREGCANIEHRAEKLSHLARFAIMYSDRVYIDNFFADYEHYAQNENYNMNRVFYEDVRLLTLIRPLLEKKSIVLFTPPRNLC